MKIEHVAMYVKDLERMKRFYVRCLLGISGELYENHEKKFKSYFIRFENGSRLELMHVEANMHQPVSDHFGYHHIAMELSSKDEVDYVTERVKNEGGQILIASRTTGLEHYVSTVADPEGNVLELLVLNSQMHRLL